MAEFAFERVDSLDPITPPSSPSAPRTLLLTGATGFLGQAIAHACLQQSAFEKIYVLVRPGPKRKISTRWRRIASRPRFEED